MPLSLIHGVVLASSVLPFEITNSMRNGTLSDPANATGRQVQRRRRRSVLQQQDGDAG